MPWEVSPVCRVRGETRHPGLRLPTPCAVFSTSHLGTEARRRAREKVGRLRPPPCAPAPVEPAWDPGCGTPSHGAYPPLQAGTWALGLGWDCSVSVSSSVSAVGGYGAGPPRHRCGWHPLPWLWQPGPPASTPGPSCLHCLLRPGGASGSAIQGRLGASSAPHMVLWTPQGWVPFRR